MSEILQGPPNVIRDPDAVLDILDLGVQEQIERPTIQDPYFAVFYKAFQDSMQNPAMRGFLRNAIGERQRHDRPLPAENYINFLPRIIQKYILSLDSADTGAPYPTKYLDSVHYESRLNEIANDHEVQADAAYDILLLNTMTTIPERYFFIRGLASLEARWRQRPISVFDIGSSVGLGLKAVVHPEFTFPEVKTVSTSESPYVHDEGLARELRKLTQEPVEFDDCIGVDFFTKDFYPKIDDWVIACLYPHELAQEEKMARYREQLRMDHPKVRILQMDFSTPEPLTFRHSLPEAKSDLVVAVTSINQASPLERVNIIENGLNRLAENGLFALMDFIYEDPSQPYGIGVRDPKEWGDPYAYRLLVYRNDGSPVRFPEVARARTSRVRDICLKIGAIADAKLEFNPA